MTSPTGKVEINYAVYRDEMGYMPSGSEEQLHHGGRVRGPETSGIPLTKLESKLVEIRSYHINWESYYQGGVISADDHAFISRFDKKSLQQKVEAMNSDPEQCVTTLISLLSHVAKEHVIQYTLVMTDDIINEDRSRVKVFQNIATKYDLNIWGPFFSMLNRTDPILMHMASRIIAKLACWSRYRCPDKDLIYYLDWLKAQLLVPGNEYLQSVAECIQWMMRIDDYREPFVRTDGINSIVSILLSNPGFQLQYQLVFSLWMLCFNKKIAEKVCENNVIPVLADTLRDSQKEKVTRIIIATFRTLIEKLEDPKMAYVSMIQCKLLPVITVLDSKNWGDEDIKEDVELILEKLNASVQDLSTFDEYTAEVKSGRLEWSPVHKSDKFWRENAIRLTENNYELLRILVKLLESSIDPLILSVACHDLGEFVRLYPRGKPAFDALGGKALVMLRMAHEDPQVKYEALVSVQKLMVHNWEFLGKQLKVD